MRQEMSQLIDFARTSVRGVDTVRQLAWGVTLGMVIGLLPKDSGLVVLGAVALILSGANLITGGLAIVSFSWVGMAIDPTAHQVGSSLLSIGLVQSALGEAMKWPLIPWFRLDNTVVMGELAIGLLAALPIYRISHVLLARYRARLVAMLKRSPITRWVLGYPESELEPESVSTSAELLPSR